MADDGIEALYAELRRLAAQNPRAARARFEEILHGEAALLEEVLTRMAAPGEGRLRQLVANLVRTRADRQRFTSHFEQWLTTETDEFARRAIMAACQDARPAPASSKRGALAESQLVEMYRYVSERLRHELQNALLAPRTRLLQLLQCLQRMDEGVTRAELEQLLSQLRDEFQAIGRMAEFEPDDDYFAIRPIVICEWVDRLNADYAKRYNRIDLRIEASSEARECRITGSDYLLRLVFWNLWVNAHQAVGDPCTIWFRCALHNGVMEIIVADSGNGFPGELVDIAFRDRFSIRGPNRGRGLLEVQDAMQKLHGTATLVEVNPSEYRVRLTFDVSP